ncbi:MAG: hypothetical protein ACYDAO_04075 [Thermoplasmataceae archaeon]
MNWEEYHMNEHIDKLNWKLRISLEPETEFSKISKKFGVKTEVGIHLMPDASEISLLFQKDIEQKREIKMFLREFNAEERNGIWFVKRKIDKTLDFFDMIRELLRIPSIVLVNTWLLEGVYRIEFIFHSIDSVKVSKTIIENLPTIDNAFLEYLGPNDGYSSIISAINERTDISLIEIELTPPNDGKFQQLNSMGNSWTYIAKVPYGPEDLGGVYLTSEKTFDRTDLIKITEDVVYSPSMENPYIQYINDEMNLKGIIPLSRIYAFHSPFLKIYMLMPKMIINSFLAVLSSSMKLMPEWNPIFKGLSGFDELHEF